MDNELYVIAEQFNGFRLDNFLLEQNPNYTRSHFKNLIERGSVLVNGGVKKAGYSLKVGDQVEVVFTPLVPLDTAPENIPLNIVYEDDDLVVINKAKGMVVHPANGNWTGTLVNALLFHVKDLSGINGVIRPGIVHRLDKDTSGLLVVAKNDFAHVELSKQIETKVCKRKYLAILIGNLKTDSGEVKTYLNRDRFNRLRFCVDTVGKFAETHYFVKERFSDYTLAEFELKTGRTHQIRVHCKHLNHPIVGDEVYGGKSKFNTEGQLLHAYSLGFFHPKTKQWLQFECDPPEVFLKVLRIIKSKNNALQ